MKTKVIRFRCTDEEASKIKALAGDDVSAWILSKLLTKVATMTQERPQVKEKVHIPPKPSKTPESHTTCTHCSKPATRKGWSNGVIVDLCIDHG